MESKTGQDVDYTMAGASSAGFVLAARLAGIRMGRSNAQGTTNNGDAQN
jgi:hypothetical protein